MTDVPPILETDPIIELYKRDVDISLIIENLRLSPQQRLEKLAQMQQFAAEATKTFCHTPSRYKHST